MIRTHRAFLAALLVMICGCQAETPPTAPTPPTTMSDTPPPPPPAPPPPPPPQSVRYRATFDAQWSAATHPSDFPGNPHFSGLIGGTHRSTVVFWREGELASSGMRRMAEEGLKSALQTEVQAAIDAGTAQHVLSGPNLGNSPASTSMEFDVTIDFPLVTLVTMVAPSPDWFVGVAGLPLFESGAWRDEVRIELAPWDAGTDEGTTYDSPNAPATPTIPIFRIMGFPFASDGSVAPMGTFTFTRIG
jgi:hypothetical protein